MEKLFYDRVVSVLRQKLGPAQAGYVYTCEYHLLTLLDIAADRVARGLALLVLLGDLMGAFPKVWRALLVTLAARPGQLGGSSRLSREVVGAAGNATATRAWLAWAGRCWTRACIPAAALAVSSTS